MTLPKIYIKKDVKIKKEKIIKIHTYINRPLQKKEMGFTLSITSSALSVKSL